MTTTKKATYKTPTGYTLYKRDVTEIKETILVNVACKNTGTKQDVLSGGIAYFIGIFEEQEIDNANTLNSKRGKMVIDLVNDEINKEKEYKLSLEKMLAQIEKLQRKVTAGKKALDKQTGAAYKEKELQTRFKGVVEFARWSWGEMTDTEIKSKLNENITNEFQVQYAEWEELATKLGKLNLEFSQKYEMKQY